MAHESRDGRVWQPDYLVAIDANACIGCGRCFKVCGRRVMTLKGVTENGELVALDDGRDDADGGGEDGDDADGDEGEFERKVMTIADAGACIGCGACARVCPRNCQSHSGAPPALP